MYRPFVLLAATAMLAGCMSVPNPVSQTTVYNLENSYGVLQQQAVAYVSFPLCPHGISVSQSLIRHCSIDTAVVQIGKADQAARVALTKAENFASYPTISPAKLIADAQDAIAAAVQIQANWGVH